MKGLLKFVIKLLSLFLLSTPIFCSEKKDHLGLYSFESNIHSLSQAFYAKYKKTLPPLKKKSSEVILKDPLGEKNLPCAFFKKELPPCKEVITARRFIEKHIRLHKRIKTNPSRTPPIKPKGVIYKHGVSF